SRYKEKENRHVHFYSIEDFPSLNHAETIEQVRLPTYRQSINRLKLRREDCCLTTCDKVQKKGLASPHGRDSVLPLHTRMVTLNEFNNSHVRPISATRT